MMEHGSVDASEVSAPRSDFSNRLKSSAKWSVIGRVGTLSASLFATALLARALGPAMGDYLIVYSALMLMTTFALSGLPLSVLRGMRLARASRDMVDALPVVNNGIAVLLAMCITMGSMFGLVVWLLGSHCYDGLLLRYLPQILIWFGAASLNWLLGEIFRGYSQFRWAAMLEGQFGGLGTIGGFVLVATPLYFTRGINIDEALWLQSAAALVSAVFGFRRLTSIQPVRFQFRSGDFRSTAWALYKDSLPVAITNLTSTSIWYIEMLMAGFWLPRSDIALYGVAKQLTRVVSQPLRLVNQSVLPFVTDLHMENDRVGMERLLRGSATIATLLALPLLIAMLLIPGQLLRICYGDLYADGGWVLQLVAIGTFVSVCVGGTGLTLIMTGHQSAQMRLAILISIVYLLIAPVAMNYFGLLGLVGLSSLMVIVRSITTLIMVHAKLQIWTLADFRWSVIKLALKRPRRRFAASSPSSKELI